MNPNIIPSLLVVAGVTILSFAGSAAARQGGFGDHSWLMTAFGLGILLVSQGPLFKLQQRVRELERRLSASGGA